MTATHMVESRYAKLGARYGCVNDNVKVCGNVEKLSIGSPQPSVAWKIATMFLPAYERGICDDNCMICITTYRLTNP